MKNTPMTLWADTEDFSEIDLKKSGHHRYAEEAEVLIWAFAWGDEPVTVWDMTDGTHTLDDIRKQVASAERVVFHNAQFDLAVLRGNDVHIPLEDVHCTMTQALAHGLVGSLDMLCDILRVPQDKAKLKTGKKLIQRFCKPGAKNVKLRRATSATHPEEWAQFLEYAGNDVDAMREVFRRLPQWNCTPSETYLWQLDQRINNRGIAVDTDLARAALRAFERVVRHAATATAEITNGEVGSTTQRNALLTYIKERLGVDLGDLTKGNVTALLKDELDPKLRRLLELRQEASSTSPAKYQTILNAVCSDGRIKGMTQFCGAARTGRDAGRLVQLQNLPRPSLKPETIEAGIAAMKADIEDLIYDRVGELCVSAVRGSLVAEDNKKLICADLSNIEGRMLTWLAGEDWKLKAFSDFDKGVGHDLYVLAYARSWGVTPEAVLADKKAGGMMRQIGKVMELALGFGGSVGAFNTMAAIYGVDLPESEVLNLVKAWRRAHPHIVRFWYNLEDAAKLAIRNPGEMYRIGAVEFDVAQTEHDHWLRLRLPSGRYLTYCRPSIEDGRIMFEGVNQYTRKWEAVDTYGGKFSENATQAAARDVFMGGLRRAEEAGYLVVLRVHDELGAETPDTPEYSAEGLSRLMATVTSEYIGLPLAAAGFETARYRKAD